MHWWGTAVNLITSLTFLSLLHVIPCPCLPLYLQSLTHCTNEWLSNPLNLSPLGQILKHLLGAKPTRASFHSLSLSLFLSLRLSMAYPALTKLLILCSLLVFVQLGPRVRAQLEETSLKLMSDAFEWPTTMSSLYDDEFGGEGEDEDDNKDGGSSGRRSLFWHTVVRYYISYGALSANRIPCPPRSGRSYYTHNCYNARTPANPYTRGCSRIARCRRWEWSIWVWNALLFDLC
jgi:hypothetical protein